MRFSPPSKTATFRRAILSKTRSTSGNSTGNGSASAAVLSDSASDGSRISYGDQRVFGPGNWGNTGRFAWDAATLKVDTRWFWSDVWVGKYL